MGSAEGSVDYVRSEVEEGEEKEEHDGQNVAEGVCGGAYTSGFPT